jgi:hypothetical protein
MALHQNGSASTSIMDPSPPAVELTDLSHYILKPADAKLSAAKPPSINAGKTLQEQDPIERLPSPTTQADAKLERWNAPRGNLWKTLAAFWSFVVMGANDAAYGALIPYVRRFWMRWVVLRLTICVAAGVLQPYFFGHLVGVFIATCW